MCVCVCVCVCVLIRLLKANAGYLVLCSLVHYYILSDDKTSSETLINTANGAEQSAGTAATLRDGRLGNLVLIPDRERRFFSLQSIQTDPGGPICRYLGFFGKG